MRIKKSSARNFVILTFFSLLTVILVLNEAVGAPITATQEWTATFDGESSNIETAQHATTDSAGNTYVVGYFRILGSITATTIKYNQDGVQQWVANIPNVIPHMVAADNYGNVFVSLRASTSSTSMSLIKYNSSGEEQWTENFTITGIIRDMVLRDAGGGQTEIYLAGGFSDNYVAIKYDTNGTPVWNATYDGGAAYYVRAIAVDAAGNAYVTGEATYTTPQTERRYVTVKYNNAGTQQWIREYGYNTGINHFGLDVAVDSSGDIVVAGSSATVKYDPAGNEAWATPNANGYSTFIKADGFGNVFTLGTSSNDIVTTKINSAGTAQWAKVFDGANNGIDTARGLTVDSGGSVYVLGDTEETQSFIYDYLTLKYDTDGNKVWTATYNTGDGNNDAPLAIALYVNGNDGLTYAMVSGAANDNLTTISYANATGNQEWTANYDTKVSSGAEGNDIAVDVGGNSYVVGKTEADIAYGDYGFEAYLIAKYGPDGTELWSNIYPETPGEEYRNEAFAVDVDLAGNVYLTGESYGIDISENKTIQECTTVKYDTAGVFQWAAVYDAGNNARCFDIAVFEDSSDGQTYAYIASTAYTADAWQQFAVVKYDSAGTQVWERTYSFIGSNSYANIASSFHLDANGTAYIGGQSKTASAWKAATVVGFDKDGNEVFESPGYSILSDDANFEALATDASGNLYAAGFGYYAYWIGNQRYVRSDLILAKYDATGDELWVQRYGETQDSEAAHHLVVDELGNAYVGGSGGNDKGGFLVVKYSASGTQQWERAFDGGKQSDNIKAMLLDSAGNLLVTGTSAYGTVGSSYVTLAYDSSGNQLWFERYTAGDSIGGYKQPRAIDEDDSGNIFVSGIIENTDTGYDLAIVKYSQAEITSDTTAPTVTEISPPNNATGFPRSGRDNDVTATFSEALDPLTINDAAAFRVFETLTGESPYGTMVYDEISQTLTFDTNSYTYETMYTVNLTSVATDLAGNPLAPYSWNFTIEPEPDTTAPLVESVGPANGASNIATTVIISATFNEPMNPNSFSVSWTEPSIPLQGDGTFQLVDNTSAQQVYPAGAGYDGATLTAFLYLAVPLEKNRSYTATLIGTGVRDASNNALGSDYSWTFTTGGSDDVTPPVVLSTDPASGASNVSTSLEKISVNFNKTMDLTSIYDDMTGFSDFTLKNTTSNEDYLDYYLTMAGGTVQMHLFSPLVTGAQYTATLLGTAADISGNQLGTDLIWSFTVSDGVPSDDQTPPHVASVTPDGSTLTPPGIGLLTVTFSEKMDATSIEGISDGSGSGAPFTLMITGGAYVTGTVVYDSGARTARFYPDANLDYDTSYQATMTSVVTDAAGNPLGSDYFWSFTTSGDPGTLGCDVDAGILAGCDNFDDFNYGTGVLVNTYTTSSTGPTSEDARRKLVADKKAFSTDEYLTDNIESEASAYADTAQLRMEARARDIKVSSELDGAASYIATKVDVTGAPPGTLIPMTVTISTSTLGDGYSAELQVHDFDSRPLGTIIVRKGLQQITRMIDLYGDSADPLNYTKVSGSNSSVMTYNLLYPAIPNNGVFLYFGAGAKKTNASLGAVESDSIATLEFNPPPGVAVTLATGQSVTGEVDTDGDGVADSEELSDGDASVATMDTPTGTGQVEVAVVSSSGTGATLSQCESLDDSDISLNQTDKPGDYAFPDGIVSFNVNGLPIGGTAVVTVTFPTAIPAESKYYKVNADGFYEFLIGAEIATNTVTLTLVDGGQGDHDGLANGVIDDPGGIAVLQACTTEIWYDGINQSCKTRSDYDQDGDDFDLEVDCDDTNVAINFGETEIWYDGINQSCKDGSDYDQDGDGHNSNVHGGDDCDDTNPSLIESCIVDLIFKNSFE